MDLALDINTADLVIERGDIALVEGIDAIRQDVSTRLQFFKGEWFLDTRIGVPYYQSILIKNPNFTQVRFLLQQTVTTTPGVNTIDRFDMSFDSTKRSLSVDFSASTTEGQLIFDQELILT